MRTLEYSKNIWHRAQTGLLPFGVLYYKMLLWNIPLQCVSGRTVLTDVYNGADNRPVWTQQSWWQITDRTRPLNLCEVTGQTSDYGSSLVFGCQSWSAAFVFQGSVGICNRHRSGRPWPHVVSKVQRCLNQLSQRCRFPQCRRGGVQTGLLRTLVSSTVTDHTNNSFKGNSLLGPCFSLWELLVPNICIFFFHRKSLPSRAYWLALQGQKRVIQRLIIIHVP